MPGPINTLLIDGSFEELAEELATYIDDIKKKQGDDSSNLHGDLGPLLQAEKKDDALKKLVTASSALNSAPEKGMLVSLYVDDSMLMEV
jgi:translation initiation factor 3 subunit M